MAKTSRFDQSSSNRCCSGDGRGFFSGGMMPARVFLSTASQRSRLGEQLVVRLEAVERHLALFIPSPWQS